MKTKILLPVLLAIQVAGLFSCTKEVSTNKIIPVEQQLKFLTADDRINRYIKKNAREGVVIVSWNEWGRKKKDCKGMGLCNAHWFPGNTIITNPDNSEGGSTILEYDNLNDHYYFDILLAVKPPTNLTTADMEFIIDYEINLDTKIELGMDLVIIPGTYQYESNRGEFGGYRIFLKSK
jgi:hypothetical protein